MRLLPVLALTALLIQLACKKPEAAPTWPQQVEQALDRQMKDARLAPEAQRSYREGFRHGSAMIRHAVEEDRVPFFPRPDRAPAPERPLGVLAPGMQVEAAALAVEVDTVTGWPLAPMLGSGDDAWKRGVEQGFGWALALERPRMDQRGLLRPLSPPTLPPMAEWKPWPELRSELLLHGERRDMVRLWRTELLAWRSDERGFPAKRTWRALTDPLRFHHVAVHGGLLWLDTFAGKVVALDRATGLVVALQPGVHVIPEPRLAESWIQQWRKTAAVERERSAPSGEALFQRAEKGNADARHKLGHQRLPEHLGQGLALIRASALQGHHAALIDLALAHLEGGWGLPKDPLQAWVLLKEGASRGSRDAVEALRQLFPASLEPPAPAR